MALNKDIFRHTAAYVYTINISKWLLDSKRYNLPAQLLWVGYENNIERNK